MEAAELAGVRENLAAALASGKLTAEDVCELVAGEYPDDIRDQVREAIARDMEQWAPKLLKIVPKGRDSGLIPLEPNAGQLALEARLQEQRDAGKPMRVIDLKSRQIGQTTWVQGHLILAATMLGHTNAITVAHDDEALRKIYRIGERMYRNLPDALRPDQRSYKRNDYIHFAPKGELWQLARGLWPDSMYELSTAGSPQAGRSGTYHLAHLSEFAFYPQPEDKLIAITQAVSDHPGTLIVIESTANGHNHFKSMWDQAVDGSSEYAAFFWPWWRHEEYTRPFVNEAERKEFRVGDTDQSPFAEEEPELYDPGPIDVMTGEHVPLTLEQLNWRRWWIANKCGGKIEKFHQEMPACLTGEMRVSTERGIIPISEAEGCRETESGPIKRWGPQPASTVYRAVTKGGRVLRGTADHPVQTVHGLKGLADLVPGDDLDLRAPRFAEKPCRVRWTGPLGSRHEIPVTKQLGRFIGYFMGDGSWHGGELSIACDAKDEDVIEDTAVYLERFIAKPLRQRVARVQGRKGMVRLRANNVAARDFMERLGLIQRNGEDRWRRKVCVPEAIWRSPRPVVREFLRGLFECDGSARAGTVTWSSSKLEFARDVQLLLLAFEINAPLRENPKTAGDGSAYISYSLDLNMADAERFHDEVGFVGKRKRAGRPAVKADKRRQPPRPLRDSVVSVAEDGHEITYDFTMDTADHLFMAQGIVTHNTPDQAFLSTGSKVFEPMLVSKAMARAEQTDPRVGEGGPVAGALIADERKMQAGRHGLVEVPKAPVFKPARLLSPGEDASWRFWLDYEDGELKIPEDGQYVVGVDVSEGLPESGEGDPAFQAIEVIDHKTKEQVAEYRSRVDPDLVAEHALLTALLFNNAWLAVEKTGPGMAVVSKIWHDFHYAFTYWRRRHGTRGEDDTNQIGWSTDRGSKPVLLAGGQELLREESHGIRSRRLVSEMQTYIRLSTGKTVPEKGKFSDLLMAWLIAQQVAMEKPLRKQKGERQQPVQATVPQYAAFRS